MLSKYKEWVKRHPNVVQNLDWLLLFTVWNPSRTNGGFELTYEAYHAAVGLLSLWHQSILDEGELPTSRPVPYLWLDAIEYLETLIELRGMHLEKQGKMSRYGPLLVVETVKAVLKMVAWSRYSTHMFLRRPTPDDLHHFESELGMQDILGSLERLRSKYTVPDAPRAMAFGPLPPKCAADGACGGGEEAPSCFASADTAAHAASATGRGSSGGANCCAAAGGGCGAGACTGNGGGGGGGSYGLREYVGEQLGQWAKVLVPTRFRRAVADSCVGPSQNQQLQPCNRVSACDGCSTSPRCSRAASVGATAILTAHSRCSISCGDGGNHMASASVSFDTTEVAAASVYGTRQGPGTCGAFGGEPRSCAGGPLGASWPGSVVGHWQQQLEAEPAGKAAATEDADEHIGRNLLWLSELLHIWRPVIYVSLLKRYGRRSWRPWTTSLAVDLLSGHFHRRGRQHLAAAAARAAAAAAAGPAAADAPTGGKDAAGVAPRGAGTSLLSLALARSLAAPGITAGEERELYDRRRKLALYALRSPFLEATTLSWLAALRNATRNVPMLGFGADYLYGLAETFTAYYCYTSGSN
ncbi:hypothetical protein Vretimale_1866 [Volvox reticuliferus]|uniref:Peroxisomal membrane protein PEX16 n=1 Tax=Volvox reticuliferus TaxID=1737510 RepID=A0A8J4DA80_9CHLO|nr:hypothetical protein Vretifemale_17408 [Volvox reticuliferus]GIL95952.1 hypothetical protein Vretimale_1866 [Volvox reticuliferus]